MDILRRLSAFLLFFLVISLKVVDAQQVPLNPVSYRIFDPFIFNPAISGSKDFLSIDIISASQRKSNSQLIGISTRLAKKAPLYLSSTGSKEFTRIGIGGYLFNDKIGLNRNLGAGITTSYHMPLNKQLLSFLSLGVTVKGVYNTYSGDTDLGIPSSDTIFPNIDLGLYFYSPTFFAGVSATNLLGNPKGNDSISLSRLPVSRQYFFQAGYKIVISGTNNIVVEPSVIVNTEKFTSLKVTDILEPMLKLYMENMCLGTYFNDFNKYSFFFQYKFPRFYLGTFFQLPRNSPYFKRDLLAEFTLGLNLSGTPAHNHW
jgi:type IX secretion system PorP/SprF family membrane protein